jgi:hypothetical protein
MRGYNWQNIQRQNQLLLSKFATSNLTYDVIDAYAISILRPDQHVASGADLSSQLWAWKARFVQSVATAFYENATLEFSEGRGIYSSTCRRW